MTSASPGAPISLKSKRTKDFIVFSLMASHTIGLSALLIFTQGISGEASVAIWMVAGIWAYWSAMQIDTHWGDKP